jgi:hypothetical protein
MRTMWLAAAFAILLTTLGAGIQDYLADMKTSMKGVEDFVQDNIAYGNFVFPSACARIPPAKRAAIVRAAGEFARSFTTSKAFIAWYDQFREQRKPVLPSLTPSMSESRAEQVAAIKQQIAETEKNAASAPAAQKSIFNDVLNALKSTLKDLQAVDKSQDAEMDKAIVESNATAKQEHAEKLATFELEYPKGDPRPLIKTRLQAFLEKTEGIDFGAKLVKKNNVMVFASPGYENKASEWKTAYRAGKEATEAARAFAREWLKSL